MVELWSLQNNITNNKTVQGFGLNIEPGSVIKRAKDDRARHGFVIVCSGSYMQLEFELDKIKKEIKIHYE